MADLLARNGARFDTAIWTAKLMLLSIGTVSTFLLFKVAVIPSFFDFALSIVPRSISCLRTWLSPPYIYIIVNFIIISIAASSSFQPHSEPALEKLSGSDGHEEVKKEEEISVGLDHRRDVKLGESESAADGVVSFFSTYVSAVVSGEYSDSDETEVTEVVKRELSADEFSYSENSPPDDEEEDSYEDTLEGTWKAIMEGNGTVKKPLLKKSDTWTAAARAPPPPLAEVSNYLPPPSYKPEMRKSETFNDRVSTLRNGGGRLRREVVLSSQDSLNERVEAFINKFNNDMRMERQESDMRYINMVKLKQATATATATATTT